MDGGMGFIGVKGNNVCMLSYFYHSRWHYDLRIFNLENNIHNNKHKRQETKNFHWGKHKGENPVTSSEIESTPKVKPENIKMIS